MREITYEFSRVLTEIAGIGDPSVPLDVELPLLYRATVDTGWIEVDGAWFLKKFYESYHGVESQFRDLTGLEAAANGRAIPDDDLPPSGSAGRNLAERALHFARSALEALPEEAPPVTAFITIGPAVYDETVIDGNVTFCADHTGESPYIEEFADLERGVIAARSERKVAVDGR